MPHRAPAQIHSMMEIRNLLSPMSIESNLSRTPGEKSPRAEASKFIDLGTGCGVLVLPEARKAAFSEISILLDYPGPENRLYGDKLVTKDSIRDCDKEPKALNKRERDGEISIKKAPSAREYIFVICIPSIEAGKTLTTGLLWEERRDDGIAPTTTKHHLFAHRRDDKRWVGKPSEEQATKMVGKPLLNDLMRLQQSFVDEAAKYQIKDSSSSYLREQVLKTEAAKVADSGRINPASFLNEYILKSEEYEMADGGSVTSPTSLDDDEGLGDGIASGVRARND